MPSRRPDGEPSLLDRIRWGNLARLAAVVAAGLLVTLGPRACSAAGEATPALPPDQPVRIAPAPAVAEPPAQPVEEKRPRARARPRVARKPRHRAEPHRAAKRKKRRPRPVPRPPQRRHAPKPPPPPPPAAGPA